MHRVIEVDSDIAIQLSISGEHDDSKCVVVPVMCSFEGIQDNHYNC